MVMGGMTRHKNQTYMFDGQKAPTQRNCDLWQWQWQSQSSTKEAQKKKRVCFDKIAQLGQFLSHRHDKWRNNPYQKNDCATKLAHSSPTYFSLSRVSAFVGTAQKTWGGERDTSEIKKIEVRCLNVIAVPPPCPLFSRTKKKQNPNWVSPHQTDFSV